MFTGIVEETGVLKNIRKEKISAQLTIQARKILTDVKPGDSIAVNGICLTVTSCSSSAFAADVMHETLNRSSIGSLKIGDHVNLERAMAADGRFGGHIVSGHIDGIGTIRSVRTDGNAVWYEIKTSEKLLRYIVEKGSIAIDGISLTVARLENETFSVSVIPHTAAETTLSDRKPGDLVNLETDCIGKYVEKLLGIQSLNTAEKSTSASGISIDFLQKHGF